MFFHLYLCRRAPSSHQTRTPMHSCQNIRIASKHRRCTQIFPSFRQLFGRAANVFDIVRPRSFHRQMQTPFEHRSAPLRRHSLLLHTHSALSLIKQLETMNGKFVFKCWDEKTNAWFEQIKFYLCNEKCYQADDWQIWYDDQCQLPTVKQRHNYAHRESQHYVQKMANLFSNSSFDLFDISENEQLKDEKIKRKLPLLILHRFEVLKKKPYSARRTAKLDLLFSTSNHPMSCRINDVKYFTRIRVTCEMAVWLKQSTQIVPANICTTDSTSDTSRNAIASFRSSAAFSSCDAFVLQFQRYSKAFNKNKWRCVTMLRIR